MSRLISIFILLASFAPVRAAPAADKATVKGVEAFEAACESWEAGRFAAAVEKLRKAAAAVPDQAVTQYWLGTALFHQMLQRRSEPASEANTVAAAAARDAAIAALERAAELDAANPETQALLGTLYGMKIDGSRLRAVRFGPLVEKHRRQALEKGSGNPRVAYLLGMCLFHTARNAESQRKALEALLGAEKLFNAEAGKPRRPLEPRWGAGNCRTFIGLTYELLGEPGNAAQYFRSALKGNPADRLAKDGLKRVTSGS